MIYKGLEEKMCSDCGRELFIDTYKIKKRDGDKRKLVCENCFERNVIRRGQCLEEAQKTINGERQTRHGKPEDSFGTIARYWETYLDSIGFKVALKKSNVTEMLSLFKHARMAGQKYTTDNYRDAGGYIGLADDFRRRESEEENEN